MCSAPRAVGRCWCARANWACGARVRGQSTPNRAWSRPRQTPPVAGCLHPTHITKAPCTIMHHQHGVNSKRVSSCITPTPVSRRAGNTSTAAEIQPGASRQRGKGRCLSGPVEHSWARILLKGCIDMGRRVFSRESPPTGRADRQTDRQTARLRATGRTGVPAGCFSPRVSAGDDLRCCSNTQHLALRVFRIAILKVPCERRTVTSLACGCHVITLSHRVLFLAPLRVCFCPPQNPRRLRHMRPPLRRP